MEQTSSREFSSFVGKVVAILKSPSCPRQRRAPLIQSFSFGIIKSIVIPEITGFQNFYVPETLHRLFINTWNMVYKVIIPFSERDQREHFRSTMPFVIARYPYFPKANQTNPDLQTLQALFMRRASQPLHKIRNGSGNRDTKNIFYVSPEGIRPVTMKEKMFKAFLLVTTAKTMGYHRYPNPPDVVVS